MLSRIAIHQLRGIEVGTLENLSQVNVIVGPNNSGKSTIIDAFLLAASPRPQVGLSRALQRRRVADPNSWLLHQRNRQKSQSSEVEVTNTDGYTRAVKLSAAYSDSETRLEISAEWPEKKERVDVQTALAEADRARRNASLNARRDLEQQRSALARKLQELDATIQTLNQRGLAIPDTPEVHLLEPDTSSGRHVAIHELYTQVAERGLRSQAKKIVTDLLPDVEDIEILTPKGQPVVYLVVRDRGALPIELAGDGVRLLLVLSFELARPVGGLVLPEEPETHLHPAAIRQAARAIKAASKRGIQAVITTHSLDLIDALLEAFADSLDALAFYRVRLDGGRLLSHRLSGTTAAEARSVIAEDLR